MSDISRRKFLADSMKALSLAGLSHAMSNAVIQSIAQSAFASSASHLASTKKYIYLSFDLAPPRWLFDIPFTPNGSSDYYPTNNIVGNYIAKDGNTISLKNSPWQDPGSKLYLPPVWGSNPLTSTGEFTHLRNNLFFMRGVDMEIDNHNLTRLRNQAPTIGGLSVAGMFAPRTSSPLPALVSGSIADSFKSDAIVSPITVAHTGVAATNNSIVTAMNYVSGAQPLTDNLMKQQLRYFDSYAKSNGFANYGVSEAKEKADAMILEGVQKFTGLWASTYNKYTGLVSQAIQSSKNRDKFVTSQTIANPSTTAKPDNRMAYTRSGAIPLPADITSLQSSLRADSTVPQLAAIFACLEIMIVNNITSICIFSLPGSVMNNVQSSKSGAVFSMTCDQHNIGTLLSTYVTSHYYRALIICMDELARVFSAQGIWQDTLIQFGSEFGRYPKEDQSGSDHQTTAGSALLVSGSFNETRVVGNLTTTTTAGYSGFTGRGTGIKNLGGAQPRVNDIVKTVSDFLDVRAVTENGASLLRMSKAELEKKNVA